MSQKPENLEQVVNALVDNYQLHPVISKIDCMTQPNREVIRQIIENLRRLIFPGYFDQKHLKHESIAYYVGDLMESISYNLTKQIIKAYRCCDCDENDEARLRSLAEQQCMEFLSRLP